MTSAAFSRSTINREGSKMSNDKENSVDGSAATHCYAVLTGRWRVNEAGVFCGTLRIAQFDFDTDPSDKFKAGVYRQMESLLNGETVPNPANNVLEGLGRYFDRIRQ